MKTENQTRPVKEPAASGDLLAEEKRQSAFYRGLLEQIADESRNTRARRLAESGLMFWDCVKKEENEKRIQMRKVWKQGGGSNVSTLGAKPTKGMEAHRKPIHKAKLQTKASSKVS